MDDLEEKKSAPARRGFAAMSPEKQREIAAKGGKAAHEKGTAHEFTADEARAAGSKGGKARARPVKPGLEADMTTNSRTTITDEQIEQYAAEMARGGDRMAVVLCRVALGEDLFEVVDELARDDEDSRDWRAQAERLGICGKVTDDVIARREVARTFARDEASARAARTAAK